MIVFLISFSVSLLALSSVAIAGQTLWQEVTADAKLRMIFSDVLSASGKTMAALEIEMPQSSNTYWRVPGETGIPLTIDSSGSKNIGELKPVWPMPRREILYGYVDYIYRGNFILPIEVEITGPSPRLELKMILGVCSEVCVPVVVEISHELTFASRDAASAIRIAQTIANTPIPWDMPQSPIGSVIFNELSGELLIEVKDPDLDVSSIIVTIGSGMTVFSPPQKSQIPGIYAFTKLGAGDVNSWQGQYVSIIFMSPQGPYEISQLLEFTDS